MPNQAYAFIIVPLMKNLIPNDRKSSFPSQYSTVILECVPRVFEIYPAKDRI